MKKRIVVALALAVLLAASASAQTTDFFELAKTGTPQQVQAALDKGADVNAQDKSGRTALMWAATHNENPEVFILALLNAGADAKAKAKAGKTALDYAKDNDNLQGTDAPKKLEAASK